MMRNFLLTCMLLLGFSVSIWGQENIVVTGIVTDTNKEPIHTVFTTDYYSIFYR